MYIMMVSDNNGTLVGRMREYDKPAEKGMIVFPHKKSNIKEGVVKVENMDVFNSDNGKYGFVFGENVDVCNTIELNLLSLPQKLQLYKKGNIKYLGSWNGRQFICIKEDINDSRIYHFAFMKPDGNFVFVNKNKVNDFEFIAPLDYIEKELYTNQFITNNRAENLNCEESTDPTLTLRIFKNDKSSTFVPLFNLDSIEDIDLDNVSSIYQKYKGIKNAYFYNKANLKIDLSEDDRKEFMSYSHQDHSMMIYADFIRTILEDFGRTGVTREDVEKILDDNSFYESLTQGFHSMYDELHDGRLQVADDPYGLMTEDILFIMARTIIEKDILNGNLDTSILETGDINRLARTALEYDYIWENSTDYFQDLFKPKKICPVSIRG